MNLEAREDEIDTAIWKKEADLAQLKARDAGKYYIWIKVVGTSNVADYYRCYCNDITTDFAEINPATMMNDYFKQIRIHQGLSYIARNQILADLTVNADGKMGIEIVTGIDINTDAS